ncbi:MAG TPA: hypothetical protein VN517_05325 [Terriglobales bacterium]|nr:hypothetical protein [Terriglobales bacterium]
MITSDSCVRAAGSAPLVRTDRYEISWRGFVYLDGAGSGAQSILKFAQEYGDYLAAAAANLRGVYFVQIKDKAANRRFSFVDNSGLYHAYVSPKSVGTSFLDIVSRERLKPEDLDPEAIVEFLRFGCIYSGRTFFPQVRTIAADEIVESLPDGSTSISKKPIPDISQVPHRPFEELLRSFSESISRERASLDLTGGSDSRLLAVVFCYFGLPFEVALSGNSTMQDATIAQEVSQVLGRDFFLTHHDPRQTDWDNLFSISDGLFDLAKSDRPIQLQRDRRARGVTLGISGAGGELFKDFWWLQDFPLYARQKHALERLYHMRFAPAWPELSYLGARYCHAAASLSARMLQRFASYASGTNTQTYDRIYYELKMRGFAGRFLTNSSAILQVHAPYLDREAVAIGYNLDRSKRFFNRYHRAMITKMSPEAAKIASTEGGMSTSATAFDLSRDLIKYVADRILRLKRKLNQLHGAPVKPVQGPDSADLPLVLRQLAAKRGTIQRLQDYGIVGKTLSSDRIELASLGPLLSLDMLIERLESKSACVDIPEMSVSRPA